MLVSRHARTLRTISFLITTCRCERNAAIRFRVWVATAVLLLAIVSVATAKYSGGSGTAQDPYQIATAADLMTLGETPGDYDKHFILTADIDLDPNLPGRRVFDKAPIASASAEYEGSAYFLQGAPFTGVFDGRGHTIGHLTIKGENGVALFGYLGSGAEVRDLVLGDVNITGSGGYIGGLTGWNNGGDISGCHSTGLVRGSWSVGGLVGDNGGLLVTSTGSVSGTNRGGIVTNCYSTGAISGSNYVGGLVGYNGGTVTACFSTGAISGKDKVGGLVGSNANDGALIECCSSGAVSGNSSVGGLVGDNSYDCTLAECYSTGAVSSTGRYAGGLVGASSGILTQCYSSGAVDGNDYVGGLVGAHRYGTVTQCYSSGAVSGNSIVGGLVGWNSGPVWRSVWDIQTSGLSGSAGGVGLTTAQMMDNYPLGLNGFANDPNWVLDVGRDYPRLAWEGRPGQVISEPRVDWLEGSGTLGEPYQLDTAGQLISLRRASGLWDKHFALRADIDLAPKLSSQEVFEQAVIPVFTGVFDGGGHTISHLTIKGENDVGLFGYLGSSAEVRDLGVVDVNVVGAGDCVGGLAGVNVGSVTNCYSTGVVRHVGTGDDWSVGGLLGQNSGSVIQCHSSGAVSGVGHYGGQYSCVGGLVGASGAMWATLAQCSSSSVVSGTGCSFGGLVGHASGSVTDCYSTGAVSGADQYACVGGLVGSLGDECVFCFATMTRCYSTGAVSGSLSVGGLVGLHENGTVTDCFWDTQRSGQKVSDGGTGKTTAEMRTAKTFLDAGWDFVGETANGTADLWWILEGKDYPHLWWEAAKK